jgi:excisionase family DNA binding protein
MKAMKQHKEKQVAVKDVADYCLVSGITVRRWIKDGKLSALKLPSGHYRITTVGFREFLNRYHIPIRGEIFESENRN